MVRLQYIDTIGYEAGQPKSFFILADMELMSKSKVAIFGTGLEAWLTYAYLKKEGICAECFVNNDKRFWGKELKGIRIVEPSTVMDKSYYVVSAMTQIKYNNEVLWQLKMHHQDNYGLAFTNSFHSYENDSEDLQKILMESINEILCGNKSMKEIIKLGTNVGPARNMMSLIQELCWTTLWSHCLIEWIYEEYGINGDKKLKMLEIGAGQGQFSLTVHKINPEIDIKWLCYNREEKSVMAVSDKYTDFPANLFQTYYGMIEEPSYIINDKFDMIVMTEVLEHFVVNPVKTMKKIRDMLTENGRLFLSTPNWGHVPLLDSWKELPEWTGIDDYIDSQVGHAYQYSKSEMEELLEASGLVIEKYALSDSNNHNMIVKRR